MSPSSVGFVAIMTSLKDPFSILSFNSFILREPGPMPLMGLMAPPRTWKSPLYTPDWAMERVS